MKKSSRTVHTAAELVSGGLEAGLDAVVRVTWGGVSHERLLHRIGGYEGGSQRVFKFPSLKKGPPAPDYPKAHRAERRKWLNRKGVEGLSFSHPFDWVSLIEVCRGEDGYQGATRPKTEVA